MSKRYSSRPSELVGADDPYAAYCLDEACMYILCRIEEDGRLPRGIEKMLEPGSNRKTIESFKTMKGVAHFDFRRNRSRLSDA